MFTDNEIIDLELELNLINYLKDNNIIDDKMYSYISNKILFKIDKVS